MVLGKLTNRWTARCRTCLGRQSLYRRSLCRPRWKRISWAVIKAGCEGPSGLECRLWRANASSSAMCRSHWEQHFNEQQEQKNKNLPPCLNFQVNALLYCKGIITHHTKQLVYVTLTKFSWRILSDLVACLGVRLPLNVHALRLCFCLHFNLASAPYMCFRDMKIPSIAVFDSDALLTRTREVATFCTSTPLSNCTSVASFVHPAANQVPCTRCGFPKRWCI